MTTERRQVSFRLDPDVHAGLMELAGPVPLAQFMEGLVKRAVQGRGGEVVALPSRQPTLPIRAPTPVAVVGLEKLEEPIGEVLEMLAEVLRAVHEARAYEQLRDAAMDGALDSVLERRPWWRRWLGRSDSIEISRSAVIALARDEAGREVAKWRKPNGSG